MLSKFIFNSAGRSRALLQGRLPWAIAASQSHSVNLAKANFFTLTKADGARSHQQAFGISPQRFFSSSSSSSSDSEDEAQSRSDEDLRTDTSADPDRKDFSRAGDSDASSRGPVKIDDLSAMIEGGDLDKMNEFQLMVFLQKVVRAFTTQRDVPQAQRSKGFDDLAEYLIKRIQGEDSQVFLHEVGDLLTMRLTQNRNSSSKLRQVYRRTVIDAFKPENEERMRPEFREMSIYRFGQLLKPMGSSRAVKPMLDFGSALLRKEGEPKPILSLFWILQKVTEEPNITNWATEAQGEIIKILGDENQIDISNINVRIRIKILEGLMEIAKLQTNNKSQMAQELIIQLIENLNNDISSLEERPVIHLMDVLTKVQKLVKRAEVRNAASQLQARVHNIVSDMALQNADLVDSLFIMEYLNSISLVQASNLNKEKTESLLDMLRSKLAESQSSDFLVNQLQNVKLLLDLQSQYEIPELEDIIVEKWQDGNSSHLYLKQFSRSLKIVKDKIKRGTASDEDLITFENKTVEKVDQIYNDPRRQDYFRALQQKLELLTILDQVSGEVEGKADLIQKLQEDLSSTELNNRWGAVQLMRILTNNLVGPDVRFGPNSQEQISSLVDKALETMGNSSESNSQTIMDILALQNDLVKSQATNAYIPFADKITKFCQEHYAKIEVTDSGRISSLLLDIQDNYMKLQSTEGERVAIRYLNQSLRSQLNSLPVHMLAPNAQRSLQQFLINCIDDAMAAGPMSLLAEQYKSNSQRVLNRLSHAESVPRTGGQIIRSLRRAIKIMSFYGRSFSFVDNMITQTLEDDEVAVKSPSEFLRFAETFEKKRRPTQKQREVLVDMLKNEDFQVESAMIGIRNESLRLVEQAKINNFYARVAREENFESKLSEEDLNASFKEALIALDARDRRGQFTQNDHLVQMLQLGKTSNFIVQQNQEMIEQTLQNIFKERIPAGQLFSKIHESMTLDDTLRSKAVGRRMRNLLLKQVSNHYKTQLEKLDMSRVNFIKLLELFVQNEWKNHETYNDFIRGFGNEFDQFNQIDSVRFIQLLVQAGLNQQDILDAVIDKVNGNYKDVSQDRRRKLVLDLIQTAVDSKATDSETFQSFIEPGNLENILGGPIEHKLRQALLQQGMQPTADLLGSLVARVDFTQDSALRPIGDVVFDTTKSQLASARRFENLPYDTKMAVFAVDDLLNRDSPKREAVFGSDIDWDLELSDSMRDDLAFKRKGANNAQRGEELIQVLKSMGYENASVSDPCFAATAHVFDSDLNAHLVLANDPLMYDGETLKPLPALAAKSIQAGGDGANTIVVDQRKVGRRNKNQVAGYLSTLGIESRMEQETPVQEGSEAAPDLDAAEESSPAEATNDDIEKDRDN